MRVSLTQAFTEVPGRSYRRAAPPFLAGGVLSPAQMHRGGSHSRTLRDQPPLVTFQLLGENASHACVLCFHLPVSVVSSEFRFSLLGFPSPPPSPPSAPNPCSRIQLESSCLARRHLTLFPVPMALFGPASAYPQSVLSGTELGMCQAGMQALGPGCRGPSQLDHCWSCDLGPVASPPCASVVRIIQVDLWKALRIRPGIFR